MLFRSTQLFHLHRDERIDLVDASLQQRGKHARSVLMSVFRDLSFNQVEDHLRGKKVGVTRQEWVMKVLHIDGENLLDLGGCKFGLT